MGLISYHRPMGGVQHHGQRWTLGWREAEGWLFLISLIWCLLAQTSCCSEVFFSHSLFFPFSPSLNFSSSLKSAVPEWGDMSHVKKVLTLNQSLPHLSYGVLETLKTSEYEPSAGDNNSSMQTYIFFMTPHRTISVQKQIKVMVLIYGSRKEHMHQFAYSNHLRSFQTDIYFPLSCASEIW